jgi:hypothetical protein
MGMAVTQAGHQLPTVKMDMPLITSGAHKAVSHFCSNDFCFKPPLDGKVKEIDEVNNIVLLEYSDGTMGVVELARRNVRAPDGFYISIKLEGDFKVGQKFSKGDILAADSSFFKFEGNETGIYYGTLAKCALAPLHNTYEDSSITTEKFANKMVSEISMNVPVTLSPKTNIESIKKVGDVIKTSEPLIVFEEVFNDDSGDIAKLLSKMGEDFEESISALGKSTKLSKYTGEIVDIRIHYNRPLEEYSDSIAKLIKAYIKKYDARANKMKGVRSDQIIDQRPTARNELGRISGAQFDGVYIEFYIKIEDKFKVGDKASLAPVALKNIVSAVIDEGKEPFSEHRESENIDFIVTPMSVVSRMTQDFYSHLWGNKCLVELKNAIRKIAEEN